MIRDFMELYFENLWSQRPRDVEYRPYFSLQTGITILREQTKLTREELAQRLNLSNSKLAYAEARGNFNEAQYITLKALAEEFGLVNLAGFFNSKLILFRRPHVSGNKTRGRQKF